MLRLPGSAMPFLGVLGLRARGDGLGHRCPRTSSRTCRRARALVPLEDVGHFVHIEQPRVVADLVLEFLRVHGDRRCDRHLLRHNRIDLALHQLRGRRRAAPLLLLHGLGERSPGGRADAGRRGPARCAALDFTGHGGSTIPVGGGYTAEILHGRRRRRRSADLGHGDGARARPRRLRRPAASPGPGRPRARRDPLPTAPGLLGGPAFPTSPRAVSCRRHEAPAPPDPFALAELSRDVRPPDYAAATCAWRAPVPADEPIACAPLVEPPWLEAVAAEPGVRETTVARRSPCTERSRAGCPTSPGELSRRRCRARSCRSTWRRATRSTPASSSSCSSR